MKRIFHKLSKSLVILAVFGLALSFSPKKAKAAYWWFGIGVGGVRINISNFYRPYWPGIGYLGWYFPRNTFFYPTFYRSPPPLRLSAWQQERLYEQSMRLLHYKAARYYTQKFQEFHNAIQERETKIDNTDVNLEEIDETIEIDIKENEPTEQDFEEPSKEFKPKHMLVADNGSVIIKQY